MITHSVIFKLKYPKGSTEAISFLKAATQLAHIPGVQAFKPLLQVSTKNKFEYGLTMQFESQQEYDRYNSHPQHSAFIQAYWIPFVEDFLEIDYLPLDLPF